MSLDKTVNTLKKVKQIRYEVPKDILKLEWKTVYLSVFMM